MVSAVDFFIVDLSKASFFFFRNLEQIVILQIT